MFIDGSPAETWPACRTADSLTFSPAGTLGTMEGEVKKKKSKKSIGELHQEMSFKIEPSEAPAKVLDTSEWPLLLKVNDLLGQKGLKSVSYQ